MGDVHMPDAPVAPDTPQPANPGGTALATQQPTRPTNELAVAALILGILGFLWILPIVGSILAIIFGAIALSQIKQGKGIGRGMAHAGLWLGVSSLVLSVVIAAVVIAAIPALQRSAQNTADATKKAELDGVVTMLESYHTQKGYYPATLGDIAPAIFDSVYRYEPNPSGCVGTPETVAAHPDMSLCSRYTVAVTLSDGSDYMRRSANTKTDTVPIPSVDQTQSPGLQTN